MDELASAQLTAKRSHVTEPRGDQRKNPPDFTAALCGISVAPALTPNYVRVRWKRRGKDLGKRRAWPGRVVSHKFGDAARSPPTPEYVCIHTKF